MPIGRGCRYCTSPGNNSAFPAYEIAILCGAAAASIASSAPSKVRRSITRTGVP